MKKKTQFDEFLERDAALVGVLMAQAWLGTRGDPRSFERRFLIELVRYAAEHWHWEGRVPQ